MAKIQFVRSSSKSSVRTSGGPTFFISLFSLFLFDLYLIVILSILGVGIGNFIKNETPHVHENRLFQIPL